MASGNLMAGKVVAVTGAGGGIGRDIALLMGAQGARVVVNDIGASLSGDGRDGGPAQQVVDEIRAAGGEAIASTDSVAEAASAKRIVETALDTYGRIDAVVNNAGILRDKSFINMSTEDFERVIAVHLLGTANFTHAAWGAMRDQNYGRVVFTSSASGVYGNFGQANYGAAKAAMIGLMNVLHLEGAKYDIRVNTLVPSAATDMTRALLPAEALELLAPENVTPAVLFLCGRDKIGLDTSSSGCNPSTSTDLGTATS